MVEDNDEFSGKRGTRVPSLFDRKSLSFVVSLVVQAHVCFRWCIPTRTPFGTLRCSLLRLLPGQYKNGGSTQEALQTLWEEGRIPRLYRGVSFALVQGPLSRCVRCRHRPPDGTELREHQFLASLMMATPRVRVHIGNRREGGRKGARGGGQGGFSAVAMHRQLLLPLFYTPTA